MRRIPFILVVGEREKDTRTVSVRSRDGTDLGKKTVDEVLDILAEGVKQLGRLDSSAE